MAHEKVSVLGIRREANYLYFLRGGHVMRTRHTLDGPLPGDVAEMVLENAFQRGADASRYLYFLDNDGDVARVPRQVKSDPPEGPAAPSSSPARICVFGIPWQDLKEYQEQGYPVFVNIEMAKLEGAIEDVREATAAVFWLPSDALRPDRYLVMIGAALAANKDVYLVGLFPAWLCAHPLVRKMTSVEAALYAANGGPPQKETK